MFNPEPITKMLLGTALIGAGQNLFLRCIWNEEALLNGLTFKMAAIDFVQGFVEGLIFGGLDVGFTAGIAGGSLNIFEQHLVVGASTGALGNVSVFLLSHLANHFQDNGNKRLLEKIGLFDVLDLLLVGLFGGLTGFAGAWTANKTHVGLIEQVDEILLKNFIKNGAREATEFLTSNICETFREGLFQQIDPRREKEKFAVFICNKMKDFGTSALINFILFKIIPNSFPNEANLTPEHKPKMCQNKKAGQVPEPKLGPLQYQVLARRFPNASSNPSPNSRRTPSSFDDEGSERREQ
jgi:hypothetical protein